MSCVNVAVDVERRVKPKSASMAAEGGDTVGVPELESRVSDDLKSEKQLSDANFVSNGNVVVENGLPDDVDAVSGDTHDQLVQLVTELKFQNEFLKSQFEGLKDLQSECSVSDRQTEASEIEGGESEDVKELREMIESLKRELLEEKQTRGAAEEALKHLRMAYSEADAKAQELSANLAEGQILSVRFLTFSCSIL